MRLLWIHRLFIRVVIHLVEQFTLVTTIMTIQLLAMVSSVIQGPSKILGPVEKSSPAAEIMDVPVQRPNDISQLWQKLFCVVGEASRPRLRNIGRCFVKLLVWISMVLGGRMVGFWLMVWRWFMIWSWFMVRGWFMVWRFWFMICRFAVVGRFFVV